LIGLGVVAKAARGVKGGSAQKRITSGTVQLKGGRTYRIELEVSGPALSGTNAPQVAQAIGNGLSQNGGYDVYVSPTVPVQASYSIDLVYETPMVLNVPMTQQLAGMPADYTFRAVQQIAKRKAS
jgi:hypothetical protein